MYSIISFALEEESARLTELTPIDFRLATLESILARSPLLALSSCLYRDSSLLRTAGSSLFHVAILHTVKGCTVVFQKGSALYCAQVIAFKLSVIVFV